MKLKLFCITNLINLSAYTNQIYVNKIENQTSDGYYRIESPINEQNILITPLSQSNDISMYPITNGTTYINSIKGDNPSIYIKNGNGFASGDCGKPEIKPNYLEIWTGEPNALSNHREFIRYCILSEDESNNFYIALTIEPDGSPKLVSNDGNLAFLDPVSDNDAK